MEAVNVDLNFSFDINGPVTQNEQSINYSGVLQKNKFSAKHNATEENKHLLKIDCPLVVKLFKHALT